MNKMFCVVDLHAITLPQDPGALRSGIREMTASLLACGLDTDRCILFQQSTVKEHSELCWILGTLCTVPRLAQLTQYKDKSEKLKEVLLGLYLYPVLQSADILLYKATKIPVGEDNIQNIQIAQYLCQKFNSTYGTYFPRPEAVLPDNNTARLRSLRNPEKKMSKSDPDPKSCIFINDSQDIIREKIKKSVTDTIKEITYDPENRPGVANLILIYSSLTNQTPDQVEQYIITNNINKVVLKEMVTSTLIEHLTPIREEMTRLLDDNMYLDSVLDKGRDSAQSIASQTIKDVKRMVGLL
ncbi:tryptophan--tRNA ligase, mitochondrial [Eurytemora carolleeae]|uniref:tryptophan--tRNA ligase, mitochondrial n=1 Tax=Eurytemora carolleeae TaxID=1294199 RepID=UPI000C7895EA|nr:tryptophan--tRNA ligase, mitochondrial [Eurytemora carolleeae]|eukprot:XP_023341431.1 tryptophan--tRNA ligase, mitochondrial-like [Eurytemora affinis]